MYLAKVRELIIDRARHHNLGFLILTSKVAAELCIVDCLEPRRLACHPSLHSFNGSKFKIVHFCWRDPQFPHKRPL